MVGWTWFCDLVSCDIGNFNFFAVALLAISKWSSLLLVIVFAGAELQNVHAHIQREVQVGGRSAQGTLRTGKEAARLLRHEGVCRAGHRRMWECDRSHRKPSAWERRNVERERWSQRIAANNQRSHSWRIERKERGAKAIVPKDCNWDKIWKPSEGNVNVKARECWHSWDLPSPDVRRKTSGILPTRRIRTSGDFASSTQGTFRSASLEFSNPAVENRMGVRVSVRPTSVGVRCGPSDVVHFHFLEFGTVWFDRNDCASCVRFTNSATSAQNLQVRLN